MHLIFDFDGTITCADTITALAHAAVRHHRKRRGVDLQATWDGVVQAYLADYEECKAGYRPVEEDRKSVTEEVRFLEAMRRVEEASLERVERSGVFGGLGMGDIFEIGVQAVENGEVVVRDGFGELLQLAEREAWPVSVISVNWSSAFIKGTLSRSQSPSTTNITIISNDIIPTGTIHGPPSLSSQLTSSSQKKQILSHITATQPQKTLYFGDSTTDMECLLHSDGGGVVISADEAPSRLRRTLERVGVCVPHVGSRGGEAGVGVCWARGFDEVLRSALLEGVAG